MNLKERILSGYKATGPMCRLFKFNTMALFARQAGLDFAIFDCEHGCYDFESLHDLFLSFKSNGVTSIVRVTDLDKNISRMLDIGADGVMVPVVNSVEQAKLFVKYAKYRPIGDRGVTGKAGYNEYDTGGKKIMESMEAQNQKNFAIVQIETQTGIDAADGIASVDGIDVLQVGPVDLAISLGTPGEYDNPGMHGALEHVVAACKKHGKIFAMDPNFPRFEEKYLKDTGIMLNGVDHEFLLSGMKQVVAYRDAVQNKKGL